MEPDLVTPLILVWNEAPNIVRCLEQLTWARRVVVVDSGSADETVSLVRRFPNADLHIRPFDDHTSQWNFGLDLVETKWVLSLDADYLVPVLFVKELTALNPADDIDAFLARFRYVVGGRALRATLYPPRAVLFRKDRCRYIKDGHTQKLQVEGQSAFLDTPFDHDDRKPLSHWLAAQDRYAVLEVEKLLAAQRGDLGLQDRLRLWMIPTPPLMFFYCLLARGLVFDGWRGWLYTWQRTLAEIILSLRLIEHRITHGGKKADS